MGTRQTLILLAVLATAAAPGAASAQTPGKLTKATSAAATAANASAASTGGATPASTTTGGTPPAPAVATTAATAATGSAPTLPLDDASKVQAEGRAVVDQILKDKEDLIMGKRFSYDPGGRRDPFRSLLEAVSHFKGPRPKGIAGMLIGEIDLVGTVRDPKGNVAFFKGSDNKGYFLHVGDEIYDGRIISIDPPSGTVTFRQRVDDPRQIKPYRDIVKRLTPLSEEEAQ
jgi:type II secretory pathway pseudopilin PulG